MKNYAIIIYDLGSFFKKPTPSDKMIAGKVVRIRSSSIANLRKNVAEKYFDLPKNQYVEVYEATEDGQPGRWVGAMSMNLNGVYWRVSKTTPMYKVSFKTGKITRED